MIGFSTLLNFIFMLTFGAVLAFPQKSTTFRRSAENAKNSSVKESELDKIEERAETPTNPLQQWLSGSSGSGSMVLGTYQALLMPMPQGQDMANGMSNVVQGIQGLLQG